MNKISINIWDDYYEDGFVPLGETQQTYIYIDELNISLENQKEYLSQIKKYIDDNNLLNNPISLEHKSIGILSRYQLNLILTHKEREVLLKQLIESNLDFNFYSES